MRCPNCETAVPDEEKFCPECGVPLDLPPGSPPEKAAKCPHCEATLLPNDQFCGECGRKVEVTVPSPAPPSGGSPPTVPAKTASPAKKRPTWVWAAIVIGALAILGCIVSCIVFSNLPEPTPTPTPTATSTSTPTPTPTPSWTSGQLLHEEDFSDPGETWEVTDSGGVQYTIENASYVIEVTKTKWMAWNTFDQDFGDFVLELDATLSDGNKYNSLGVLFLIQDKNNFYELSINGNSSYVVRKQVEDEWIDIIDWTSSDAIKEIGATNRILLVAYQGKFILYANDQYVVEFIDDSFGSGDMALLTAAYDNPPVRSTFDNIKVWEVVIR
jgi:hypothetical protein